jgi:ABC-type nitrate/sulfonate/bicarbonate transport system permease component
MNRANSPIETPADRDVATAIAATPSTTEHRRGRPAGEIFLRMSSIVLFFLIWQGISTLNVNVLHSFNPILLPAPLTVLETGVEMAVSGELWQHIWASLTRVIQGFTIAAGLGVVIGALVGRSRLAENLIDPVIVMLRPIPPLAFLPMMVLWFGIGEFSKIAFIAYAAFFPIFTTTVEGIKYIDPILIRAAASLGASRRDIFRHVVLPAAFPSIVTGLRIGFGIAFFVIVAAEFIAADAGLGFLINDSRTFFLVPRMLLGAAVIGAIGFIFNTGLRMLEDRLLRWRRNAQDA